MFTYLTFVLALILALCTGVSSGQCPDNCNCYEIDAHGTSVNCSGQQLLTIPIVYPETGFLNLSNNLIESIHEGAFKGLPNLERLDLSNNQLESIPDDAFKGLPILVNLHLNYNRLRNIPRAAFSGMLRLTLLDLSNNLLESISDGAFQGVPGLFVLFLNSNRLRSISQSSFSGMAQLSIGDLNTDVKPVNDVQFQGVPSLNLLILSDNLLESIPDGVFREVTNLNTLVLLNNPLNCDCQMRWLMEAVKGGMYKLNVYDAKCTQPAHLKGRDIANLTQADFNCSTQRDEASTFQTLASQSTATPTTESSTFVYVGAGLGVLVLVYITSAVIVIINKKHDTHGSPNSDIDERNVHADPDFKMHKVRSNPLQRDEQKPYHSYLTLEGSEHYTMADYELKENEYDHIADIDLYTNKNDVNADVTRARHLSNRELPPLPGATSSTDDDYLIPMTATLTMDISLTLNTKDKLLRQTIHT